MAILRWDPLRDLSLLQERFDRFFEGAVTSEGAGRAEAPGPCLPAVDIYETASYLVFQVEIPGVRPEEIAVEIQNDLLVLRGERRMEKEVGQEHCLRMECAYGPFRRSFPLPPALSKEGIRARLDRGVLEIRIPKARRRKAIRVTVEPDS